MPICAIPVNGCELRKRSRKSGAGLVRQVLVDGNFGQIGAEHVDSRLEHDRHQCQDDLETVGLEVTQQPPHQPGVVSLAEYLFFVTALRLLVMGHSTLF
jgi:hypothetical protein